MSSTPTSEVVPTITAMSTVQELMYFLSFACTEPDDLDEVKSILLKRENGFKMELEKLRKDVDNLQEEYELKEKFYGLIELEKTKYETELMESRKECYELKQKILELNENHEQKVKQLEVENLEIQEKSWVYKRELDYMKEKIKKSEEIDVRGILGKNVAGSKTGKEGNGSYDSGMKGSQLNPEAEGLRKVTGQLGSDPMVRNLSEDDLLNESSTLKNVKIEKDPEEGNLVNTFQKRKRSENEEFQKDGENKWTCIADMNSDLKQDPQLCLNAVCALHRYRSTYIKDSLDYSKGLATYLINGDPEKRLRLSVSEVREKRPKLLESCEFLAVKLYNTQLFEIYQKKLDPYFPS